MFEAFDRSQLRLRPLAERTHDVSREVMVYPGGPRQPFAHEAIPQIAARIAAAGAARRTILFACGAHVLRTGNGPLLIDLMRRGLLTHLALNGAGSIHDFELAMIGQTCESVARYVRSGEFGLWHESGRINEAAVAAARQGIGLGEAIGRMIEEEKFPYRETSVLAAGVRYGVPVTVHVSFGQDIVHEHPNFDAAAAGVATYRDFLVYTQSLMRLEGGVYLNIGTAVMGPEVYLKAITMARNVAHPRGEEIRHFTTAVFDLPDLGSDLHAEAKKTDPRYYFRPYKTVLVRTVADGGTSFYVQGDHRLTVPALYDAVMQSAGDVNHRGSVEPEKSGAGDGRGVGRTGETPVPLPSGDSSPSVDSLKSGDAAALPKITLSRRAGWAGGQPIASILMAKTLAHPEIVSLAAGFVEHQNLPVEPTRTAWEALWSDPARARSALQYGTTAGYPPLRAAILDRMLQADGRTQSEMNLSTDQVVITAGSNQLLYLVGDVLLDPGDIVLCGAPTYFVYLGTLENLGARAIGVEVDEHGMIPEAIEEELRRLKAAGQLHRVKAIYATTSFDNPTGATIPAERRAKIVELAKRWSNGHRIHVIEDTAYRELRYWGGDIPSMRSMDPEGDTVIVAGSFSKSYSPGVRVGWGVLPRALVEPVLAAKGHLDFGSPNVNQSLMSAVVEMGLFDPHIARLRACYREKIAAVLKAADDYLRPIPGIGWVRPEGGLYVWLTLPESIDTGLSGPLFDRAVEEGVLYVPGEFCYPKEGRPAAKNRIRLSFGIPSCEDARRGVEALGRAIRQVLI
jgi:2-aminoadipate transaminase